MFGLKSKEETKSGLAERIKNKVLYKTGANGHKDSAIGRIDEEIRQTISRYSTKPEDEINERLDKLEKEWTAEKMVRTNAVALSVAGLALGLFANRRWLLLSGLALPFLAMKKPMKMAGVRTRKEIEAEKYALRSLRGDFAR